MNIDREIQEQEMKLKEMYYQRDAYAKSNATEASGLGGELRYGADTCGPSRFSPEWIRDIVSYHQPGPDGVAKINAIRLAAENFLRCLIDNCPDSADRSESVRLIRTAMMTANASIVLNGRG